MDSNIDLDIVKSTLEGVEKISSSVYGHERSSSDVEIRKPFPLIPIHTIDVGLDDSDRSPHPTKGWSIFKVPLHLREVNERGYEPRIVSVGPFHYKRPALEHMESHKLRILKHYFTSSMTTIEDAMKILEMETRSCYSKDFTDIDSESFTRMMLLDGCFVVHLLRLGGTSYKGKPADGPIFATRWMPLNIGCDLLLLENQLPLFVLHKIFELTTSSSESEEKTSLNELALQFFEPLRPGKDTMPINGQESVLNNNYPHLLALFQSSCAPTQIGNYHHYKKRKAVNTSSNIGPCNTFTGKGWTYGANWLSKAGVTFISKPANVLDIEYDMNRKLKIPTIYLDGNTMSVLRNLVAYEQCDKCAQPYFTSHAFFFSNILGKVEDTAVLIKSGIIRQAQGVEDYEVVTFFNNLAKDLVFDMNKCWLANIIEDIQIYSQSKLAKMRIVARPMFTLPRVRFLDAILLILSVLQIVFFVITVRR